MWWFFEWHTIRGQNTRRTPVQTVQSPPSNGQQDTKCDKIATMGAPLRTPAPPTMRRQPPRPYNEDPASHTSMQCEGRQSPPRADHAGAGHGHGEVCYIYFNSKSRERAQVRKLHKRAHARPTLCVCFAHGLMFLRSQVRLQTERNVRSYGVDKFCLGMHSQVRFPSRLLTCPDFSAIFTVLANTHAQTHFALRRT